VRGVAGDAWLDYNPVWPPELSIIRGIDFVVKETSAAVAGAALSDARLAELAAEILSRCDALADCSDDPHQINRVFCSPAMREAHDLACDWMRTTGLAPYVDSAANLIGRLEPPDCDTTRRVIVGSHLDTVVDAGRYDGILGVMLGIATAAAVRELEVRLPWALEVIGFSDEEGVRFGVPFLGSRALAGTFDMAQLSLRGADGVTVAQALREFGLDPLMLSRCAARGDVVAYLEAHIEQGPLLEMLGLPLGVVTDIAGQTRLTVEWTGEGGHAGTVPMHGRGDAFTTACRWALAVERVAQETTGLVATVGKVEVEPNVPNCIPRLARVSLDIRHHGDAVRRAALENLVELAEQLARDSRLAIRVEYDHEHVAVAMNETLTETLAASVEAAGSEPQRMVSGAGHDAGVMAAIAPTSILFVRSPGGVSHHPDEAVTLEDVASALRVMIDFVQRLAMN
jgi:allantoate deiminase